MVLFASFNGPSDAKCWFAIVASATVAVLVGLMVRSPWKGCLGGGVGAAFITAFVLGSASGDMVGLVTAFATPILGFGGALVGCCAGAISARFINRKDL